MILNQPKIKHSLTIKCKINHPPLSDIKNIMEIGGGGWMIFLFFDC